MTNTPIIAGIDWGKSDECAVVVMQDKKVLAAFKGKYAVLQAANWARMKNLKIKMLMERNRV